MLHTVILFVHVASAMGIIAGVGIEGVGLAQLRLVDANAPLARAMGFLRQAQRVAGPSMGLTLLSGLYLAGAYWGWRQGWINVVLASVVLIMIVGGTMTGRTLAQIGKAAPNAPTASALATLRTSYVLRVFILAGIVFLMTNKTAVVPSIIAMLIAIALGLVVNVATSRQRREMIAERPASR